MLPLIKMLFSNPAWMESAILALIGFQSIVITCTLLYMRKAVSQKTKLVEEETARRLAEWQPEPLVSKVDENHLALRPRIVSGRVGRKICVNGKECLNMASHNFLGLLEDQSSEQAAIECINKFGVGSCGPRGFYGTNDIHLQLEDKLAVFMKCEEAALYAYGFAALASAIPSYCKRGDLVFVDEAVNFSIQRGLEQSRSKVVYFKHNDPADLERILLAQQILDKKKPKLASRQRRFLIAEAIYQNTGNMCPLKRLVQLRQQFKLRFILDESISFGTIGNTGRGITELLGVNLEDVDLIVGTLESSVASNGGFCVGTTYIVDHQRLSGTAYCFSAASPPFLARAAISALDRLQQKPEIVRELNERSAYVHDKFGKFTRISCSGHPLSPIKHLYVNGSAIDRTAELNAIQSIVEECNLAGLAVTSSEYLDTKETHCPRPSIRVAVNRLLTNDDIDYAFNTIERITTASS